MNYKKILRIKAFSLYLKCYYKLKIINHLIQNLQKLLIHFIHFCALIYRSHKVKSFESIEFFIVKFTSVEVLLSKMKILNMISNC